MIKYKLVTLISSLLFSFSVLANETPAVIGGVEMASGEKSAAFEQVRKKLGKWKGTMTQGATGAVFDVSVESGTKRRYFSRSQIQRSVPR